MRYFLINYQATFKNSNSYNMGQVYWSNYKFPNCKEISEKVMETLNYETNEPIITNIFEFSCKEDYEEFKR